MLFVILQVLLVSWFTSKESPCGSPLRPLDMCNSITQLRKKTGQAEWRVHLHIKVQAHRSGLKSSEAVCLEQWITPWQDQPHPLWDQWIHPDQVVLCLTLHQLLQTFQNYILTRSITWDSGHVFVEPEDTSGRCGYPVATPHDCCSLCWWHSNCLHVKDDPVASK